MTPSRSTKKMKKRKKDKKIISQPKAITKQIEAIKNGTSLDEVVKLATSLNQSI